MVYKNEKILLKKIQNMPKLTPLVKSQDTAYSQYFHSFLLMAAILKICRLGKCTGLAT